MKAQVMTEACTVRTSIAFIQRDIDVNDDLKRNAVELVWSVQMLCKELLCFFS